MTPGDVLAAIDHELAALRADERRRAGLIAVGLAVGLGVGSLHWFGLVLGGALVALPARSVRRGLVHGLSLGLVALLAFAALLAGHGALGPALGTGPVGALTLGIGVAAPLLGSLVRGLV